MSDPYQGDDEVARAEVLRTVRVVHHYVPESSLSVHESVDVRRDLTLLVIEAHRHVFRRPVAVTVCAAVLAEVAGALPEQVRAEMLRSCALHLGWALTADAAFDGSPDGPLSFLRAAADGSYSRGGARGGPVTPGPDGPTARGPSPHAATTARSLSAPPLATSSPPRPRSGRHDAPVVLQEGLRRRAG